MSSAVLSAALTTVTLIPEAVTASVSAKTELGLILMEHAVRVPFISTIPQDERMLFASAQPVSSSFGVTAVPNGNDGRMSLVAMFDTRDPMT